MTDHGTRTQYLRGCRCDPCRRANSTYFRERRAELNVLNGRPVRTHVAARRAVRAVAELRQSGLRLIDIAERSGVSYGTVARLGAGTARRVEYWVADHVARLA